MTENIFVIFVIISAMIIFSWIKILAKLVKSKAQQNDQLRNKLVHLAEYEERIDRKERQLPDIQRIAKEKTIGFPWLAQAYADYFHLQDSELADYLRDKSPPAVKSSEHVREIASKRRIAEKLLRIYKYQIEYYETLFPWLTDFKEEGIDDLVRQITDEKIIELTETLDASKDWLTSAEYETLSQVDKYQMALDRYLRSRKSKWQIGRDYERYIGYKYEINGARVYYQGIIKGFEDLGRDLIVTHPNGNIEIVQCKCWSREKMIHEKHIFQLYGTVLGFKLSDSTKIVSGTFTTSTELSETAKRFAKILGITFLEKCPLETYPLIKCNVSSRGLIYHLPFDQQYDRTLITEKLERYVSTVKEAEQLGFRRAMRWTGQDIDE
jgi:hypothetical protein